MSDYDDHVIPYEEAVRRHRAREAERRRGAIHEVKISDAMSHLLEEEAAQQDAGPSPAVLRQIVEHEFLEQEGSRSGERPDERPAGETEGPVCRLDEHRE